MAMLCQSILQQLTITVIYHKESHDNQNMLPQCNLHILTKVAMLFQNGMVTWLALYCRFLACKQIGLS